MLLGVQNGRKARLGGLAGLQDPAVMQLKRNEEETFRKAADASVRNWVLLPATLVPPRRACSPAARGIALIRIKWRRNRPRSGSRFPEAVSRVPKTHLHLFFSNYSLGSRTSRLSFSNRLNNSSCGR